MSRPRNAFPTYSVATSGRAYTTVAGKFVSLGKDGPEAKQKFATLILSLQQGDDLARVQSVHPAPKLSLSINELCIRFVTHAEAEYIDRVTGKPSAEVDCFKCVTKALRTLFGETVAAEFGPLALRALRQKFIAAGWSRGFINKSCQRLRTIFRWGIGRELLPKDKGILEGLQAVEPLRLGKGGRETTKRRAIPQASIDAMKERLGKRNRDIVDLLLLTAARPSEILSLTTAIIQNRETIDGVWIVDLQAHKTAHHGHERRLFLSPAAQAILLKYIDTANPERRLFPIQRKTLGQAVKDASNRAGVPEFTSHWLRHTALSRLRDEAGAEATQQIAGHATLSMTSDYTRASQKAAVAAVRKLG